MRLEDDAPLLRVMRRFGVGRDALLGIGGEACVFALGKDRILRVHHPGTTRHAVEQRARLLEELHRSAGAVPFAIPRVDETVEEHGRLVTIEPRLPGRPLLEVLGELTGAERDHLLTRFLDGSARLHALRVDRPWYGDLCDSTPVRASSYRAYLEERARRSLAAAGGALARIDAAELSAALPEPDRPSFVHLDLYPGNVLVEGREVSAVVDFGGPSLVGDARLDPLSAAIYLTPYITPAATDRDRSLAREWLKAQDLADLFAPAERWLAARWAFARDDVQLHAWCRRILLGHGG